MKQTKDYSQLMSLVMITKDRKADTLHTLGHVRQEWPGVPLIVVDNNSIDGTPEAIAQSYPEAEVVRLNKNMGALGRNIGVDRAKTPYIAFIDDDSWWDADALPKSIAYFEKFPDVGLLAGRILVKDKQKLDATSALQSISPLEPWVDMPGPAILGFLGCGIFVRRQAFVEVGGYNKYIYFSGEEELLGIDLAAAGWGLSYCEDLIGHHYPSTIRNMPQRYRMGARNVILAAWMRRPVKSAMTKTWQVAKQALGDGYKALGLVEGLFKLPIALANRRVIPDWLESNIVMLQEQNAALAKKAAKKQRQTARSVVVGSMSSDLSEAGT